MKSSPWDLTACASGIAATMAMYASIEGSKWMAVAASMIMFAVAFHAFWRLYQDS